MFGKWNQIGIISKVHIWINGEWKNIVVAFFKWTDKFILMTYRYLLNNNRWIRLIPKYNNIKKCTFEITAEWSNIVMAFFRLFLWIESWNLYWLCFHGAENYQYELCNFVNYWIFLLMNGTYFWSNCMYSEELFSASFDMHLNVLCFRLCYGFF